MDRDAVLALFDQQMRRDVTEAGPPARIERAGQVLRQVGSEGTWTGVIWSHLDAGSADAAIGEQVRYFSGLGREFEWKLYGHDRPADLGERLRAAGFTADPEETLMVAEAAALPREVELPAGVRLAEVTDAAGVDLLVQVHDLAFDEDHAWLRRRLLTQLAEAPDTVAAVVALAGDVPVCAARAEFGRGTEFAGLWGGGTVPGWRSRGLYRALVAYRAGLAVARGFRYLQVDASAQSRPILERLGFVSLTSTTPCSYRPPRGSGGLGGPTQATQTPGRY